MIGDVEESGDAEGYVKGLLDRGERLMGFGHRVYRAEDPRARVLRRTAKELGAPRHVTHGLAQVIGVHVVEQDPVSARLQRLIDLVERAALDLERELRGEL
jgi:citrate synthase